MLCGEVDTVQEGAQTIIIIIVLTSARCVYIVEPIPYAICVCPHEYLTRRVASTAFLTMTMYAVYRKVALVSSSDAPTTTSAVYNKTSVGRKKNRINRRIRTNKVS